MPNLSPEGLLPLRCACPPTMGPRVSWGDKRVQGTWGSVGCCINRSSWGGPSFLTPVATSPAQVGETEARALPAVELCCPKCSERSLASPLVLPQPSIPK